MKSKSFAKIVVLFPLILNIVSCGPSAYEKAAIENNTKNDSISEGKSSLSNSEWLSSSAAKINTKDSTHQFIRTAELKFRVKNV